MTSGNTLGRYWGIGPQTCYYVPGAWLKSRNELIILDERGGKPDEVKLVYSESALPFR